MNILCIIPARGGSKGIPQKNIAYLAGKPLIAWSIEAAQKSTSVTRIVVSTDDHAIAAVSQSCGAEVIHRPAELAGDTAPSESALSHVIDFLEEHEQYKPDLIVFLQATSPYREPLDIDDAVSVLINGKYDSVFSAYPEHFVGRWQVDENGNTKPVNFDPRNRPRRQERSAEYVENGSIYVFKPNILQTEGSRIGGRVGIFSMPPERSYQVDTPEGLLFLEKLMSPGLSENATLQYRIPPSYMLKGIKLLVLDFDGVLTDNNVWVNELGQECVCCSRSDSWGLQQLKTAGIQVAVISTERNPVVEARCNKLDIICISNAQDKAEALSELAVQMKVDRTEVAFVGNDTNDRDALAWAGISVLVNNAEPSLEPLADWILKNEGGKGAVRECCEVILNAR